MTSPASDRPASERPADADPLEGFTAGAEEIALDPVAAAARSVWWIVLIRGIAALAFGVIAIVAPVLALTGIVFVFAAFAIVDGVLGIAHAIRARHARGWGWLLVQGIIFLLAGLVAFALPGFAGLVGGLVALWVIAIYSVVTGAFGIPAAASLTADGGRKAIALISSILSLVFGIVLMVVVLLNPGQSVLSLVWLVGIWAVVIGVMLVVLAIQARIALGRGTRQATA